MKYRICIAALFCASITQAQTVSISGTVLSVSGAPIAGATCQFRSIANKAVTDAQGKYAFSGAVGIRQPEGYAISMQSQGRSLSLSLDRRERVSLDLFSVGGRLVRKVAEKDLAAGTHTLAFAAPEGAQQLYLLRVSMGSQVAWHKVTLQNGVASLTSAMAASVARPLAKAEAALDSLFCTEPGHHGGLAKINGRAVSAYTGTYNFRMFSSDPAWATQCSMPMTFNFDASAGVAKYKSLVPDWVKSEQEILMEVCQSTFKLPTQPKKYASYTANIKSMSGVANTGGNTLNFSSEYIDGQSSSYSGWYEIMGVQTHEAVHSYQAYYNTTGASGFGEAMPDAVRALNGFFRWPTGTKCTGSFTDVYQTGGKYWYFIEMKHPGFLTSVWQKTADDISVRVQSITGESLSAMASECQTKGMP
ncbi:MAG: hypothetical protein JWP91_2078 [Fibrobacteres bacterium]|nr:hypothetical protein [Fibrobacterota bacterium]